MPRPRLFRRVSFEPNVTYFKPAGIRLIELEESTVTVDEFEAIRLKDFLGMEQEEAAKKMNISQPTFHRLVLAARKKIADALVNGKAIRIEGGNFKMVQKAVGQRGIGRKEAGFGDPAGICICPACGYKESKKRGIPCNSTTCLKCKAIMIRGDS